MTLSLVAGPAGATLSGGEIRWSPTGGETAPVVFTVRATETGPDGLLSEATFSVSVENRDPELETPADRGVLVGEPIAISLAASDPGTADVLTATIDWGGRLGARDGRRGRWSGGGVAQLRNGRCLTM